MDVGDRFTEGDRLGAQGDQEVMESVIRKGANN
jgi:hypothetical protein